MSKMTKRQEAEIVECFAADLKNLIKEFDRCCDFLSSGTMDRVNAVAYQDKLDDIALTFADLGLLMHNEAAAAEELDDMRRDNPLEPDYRKLGQ